MIIPWQLDLPTLRCPSLHRHTGMSMDLRRVQLSGSAAERGSQEMSRTQSMEVAERPSFGFGTLGHRPNANTVPPGKTPDWEGWLAKESKMMLMSKWQKRYFVLFGKHLLYWVEEADFRNGMPFKGNVNLEGCSLVENAAKGQQKQCFGIHHPQRRDYLLAAGSPELLAKWVNKIEGVLGPYLLGENVSMADFDILSVVGKGAAGTVYQVCKQPPSSLPLATWAAENAQRCPEQSISLHQGDCNCAPPLTCNRVSPPGEEEGRQRGVRDEGYFEGFDQGPHAELNGSPPLLFISSSRPPKTSTAHLPLTSAMWSMATS